MNEEVPVTKVYLQKLIEMTEKVIHTLPHPRNEKEFMFYGLMHELGGYVDAMREKAGMKGNVLDVSKFRDMNFDFQINVEPKKNRCPYYNEDCPTCNIK